MPRRPHYNITLSQHSESDDMPSKRDLTHFNDRGEAHMVDVGNKEVTGRKAVAEGRIEMAAETLEMLRNRGHKKGDVLGVARTAGIMAAKKTSELIPLCHSLMLTKIHIDLELDREHSSVGVYSGHTEHRAHRGGNGGIDRCAGDVADHLRYV